MKFLVYGGKTGWIGSQLCDILKDYGHTVVKGSSRLENRKDVIDEINKEEPDRVLNAAGVTGSPNVDWCETNQEEAIRSNVIGSLNIADICSTLGKHCTIFATGCIYEYDEDHLIGGTGFVESDKPNFDGSFYSKTKGYLDEMLKSYSNVLVLRLRMPLSSEVNARNFIIKISKYAKVVNVPNSMSDLDTLLPVSVKMSIDSIEGTFNFCNPGVISHNEVLDLYKKHVDNRFNYENFTISEQNLILKSKRSNNHLDVTKLMKLFPDIPTINDATRDALIKMGVSKA